MFSGLCFGAALLTVFGSKIGHWKWTLTASVTVMVVFGALLALGNPERKGMMVAFVFLSMTGFGWAQYLSIAFIQFGVPQVELGISGGLAGVSRFAGGAIAISGTYKVFLMRFLFVSGFVDRWSTHECNKVHGGTMSYRTKQYQCTPQSC